MRISQSICRVNKLYFLFCEDFFFVASIVLHLLVATNNDECKRLDGAITHGALVSCGPGLPDD